MSEELKKRMASPQMEMPSDESDRALRDLLQLGDPEVIVDNSSTPFSSSSFAPKPSTEQHAVARTHAFEFALRHFRSKKHVALLPWNVPGPKRNVGMLAVLADSQKDREKAEFLLEASERCAREATADAALAFLNEASKSDPTHPVVVQSERRNHLQRGDWEALVQTLEREISLPYKPAERMSLLTLLATLQSERLQKKHLAIQTLKSVTGLWAQKDLATLLLSRLLFQTQPLQSLWADESNFTELSDPALKGLMHTLFAFSHELQQNNTLATQHYQASITSRPSCVAWVGLYRTGRDPAALVETLTECLRNTQAAPVMDVLLERLSHHALHGSHASAANAFAAAISNDNTSLRLLIQIANHLGQHEQEERMLKQWLTRTIGFHQAYAKFRLADLYMENGRFDLAYSALNEVKESHPMFASFSKSMKHRLKHLYPQAASPDDATTDQHDLMVQLGRDAALLRSTPTMPLSLQDPWIKDIACDLFDYPLTTNPSLPDDKLLAFSLFLPEANGLQLLHASKELMPGRPSVLRALARRLDLEQAGALLLEEAAVCEGKRAAFSATLAGYLWQRSNHFPAEAFRRALDLDPQSISALTALRFVSEHAHDVAGLKHIRHMYEGSLALLLTEPNASESQLESLATSNDPLVLELMLRKLMSSHFPVQHYVDALLNPQTKATDDLKLMASVLGLFPQNLSLHAEIKHSSASFVLEMWLRAKEWSPAEIKSWMVEYDEDTLRHFRWNLAHAFLPPHEQDAIALERFKQEPTHLPSLRKTENSLRTKQQLGDLVHAMRHYTKAVSKEASFAYTRATYQLAVEFEPNFLATDTMLLSASRFSMDPWLAIRVVGATLVAFGEPLDEHVRACQVLHASAQNPDEKACWGIRLAHAYEALGRASDAASILQSLQKESHGASDHPILIELIARIQERLGQSHEAALSWTQLASISSSASRKSLGWFKAAILYSERLSDTAKAIQLLRNVVELDVGYSDAAVRLETLLKDSNDTTQYLALLDKRLRQQAQTAHDEVSIRIKQAEIFEQKEAYAEALKTLLMALEKEAEHPLLLKKIIDNSYRIEDYKHVADAMIRLARISRDPSELRSLFFGLGDIFEKHLPDLKRAEMSYKRVLEMVADDTGAVERLCDLYNRNQRHEESRQLLQQLIQKTTPAQKRHFRFLLAESEEASGRYIEAAKHLALLKQEQPTDLRGIRSLFDFYSRHGAVKERETLLLTAIADYKSQLMGNLANPTSWRGLSQVYLWLGKAHAAHAIACIASSMGLFDPALEQLLQSHGEEILSTPPTLHELWMKHAPTGLSSTRKQFLEMVGQLLERLYPFSLDRYKAIPVDTTHPVKRMGTSIATTLGIPMPQLYISREAPRVFAPIAAPATLLLGQTIVTSLTDHENAFLLARAMIISHAGFATIVRTPAEELALFVAAIAKLMHIDVGYQHPSLSETEKRLGKLIPRSELDALRPLMLGFLPETSQFFHEITTLAMTVSSFADEAALLITRSPKAAIHALAKLGGEETLPVKPQDLIVTLTGHAEVVSLLRFMLSERYFATLGD